MIICADDFGMAEDIDRAVLELVGQGKVSAVSCAVSHAQCRRGAMRELACRNASADMGLHLVLTEEGQPSEPDPHTSLLASGRFHTLGRLLMRTCARQIDTADVIREIRAQYCRFQELAGRPPEFIDGHLHVHQFPVIRSALLQFLCELPTSRRPYVRNTHMAISQVLRYGTNLPKNLLIGSPGGTFRRMARRCGLLTNSGFAGVYNYVPGMNFSRLFSVFLSNLPSPNAILMIHPGINEAWRRCEYRVLRDWKPPSGMPNRFVSAEHA